MVLVHPSGVQILFAMNGKITLDEWIEIATQVFEEFASRFSDDGKISVGDGIALFLVLLKAIAKAAKD